MVTKAAPSARFTTQVHPSQKPLINLLTGIARNVGIAAMGSRGTGKSSLLFLIAWLDYVKNRHPTIILDPVGGVTNRLFTTIAKFREEDQRLLWQKIRYVNMSAPEFVIPMPFYAPHGIGRESFFSIAQRFPDLILRADSALSRSSVQGQPPLWRISTSAGVILQALDLGITEMAGLLLHARDWNPRFTQALKAHPDSKEVAKAVEFFREDFLKWDSRERRTLTGTLLTKLAIFEDEQMAAQFGFGVPGLSLQQVMDEKMLVIFDLSGEHEHQTRQFKMLYLFLWIMEFVKRWGPEGGADRAQALSLVIDEAVTLLGAANNESPLLASDFEQLINVYSRNYNCYLSIGFQEPYQLPDGIRETFLSLGTHFIGRLTDPEGMRLLTERHHDYSPYWLKKLDAVYRSDRWGSSVIDERETYFSVQEQIEMNRQKLNKLRRYQFMVRPVFDEGDTPQPLRQISISDLTQATTPIVSVAGEAKRHLMQRDGVPYRASTPTLKTEPTVFYDEDLPPPPPPRD